MQLQFFSARKNFVSLAILSLLIASPAKAQSAATTAFEEVATAGPFVARSSHRQRFYSQFKLGPDDLTKPLTLVLQNGIGGAPSFNWIRVLLGPDMDVSRVKSAEEPTADLVYDENYIERHTVSVDLSGKVFAGINTLILELTGPKNAVISWVLEGPLTPELATINPSAVETGGRLTLAGKGFSVDPGENRVTINGREAQVLSSTRTSLTLKIPPHLNVGPAQVVVITNNIKSAPYNLSISGASQSSPTTAP